ncbi:NAD-dependent epimerase/dehydratase family protein [Wenjunlia tyrosinilytica]|uniref:NAD-dependent epimerase/dehydratase domain-containing protein n=1 Tax=Wenjunlia tyrosinilytica TaxID=1544741 RepID=A0A917ZLT6_9ACTN|nr:NAD(P)-dependent oxidoreductase [Wenjunlia tyrosinilytica]GGO85443.1 hypothetical protein GCM10012280_19230 [Wenjunlia tyrosinilytica]
MVMDESPENGKRILLAGASGVLGRHLERAFTAAGYRVTGLGRAPDNDVSASLLDRDALLMAVDGMAFDIVIHAATALREAPMRHRDMAATNWLRIEGTENLLAAAKATGARRFVAESMVFGYGFGDHGDVVITEEGTPFGPHGRHSRLERHIAAMRTKEELTFTAEGIEGIALRYGLLYGQGATDAIVELLRKRTLPVPEDRGRVLPWAELGDAARATVAAVERGRPGEAYNIVDDVPRGFGGHVRAVADTLGLRRPMTVPVWMMRPLAYAHAMMTTTLRVSNGKAQRELGWTPEYPDSFAGLRAYARDVQSVR